MNKYCYILALIIFSSCSHRRMVCFKNSIHCVFNPVLTSNYLIDSAFIKHIQQFKVEHEKFTKQTINTNKISIQFSNKVSKTQFAICHKQLEANAGEIFVNKEEWFNSSEIERELIIFHELGHCALGILSHIEEGSLMKSSKLETIDYIKNRDKYLKQLFTVDTYSNETLDNLKQNPIHGWMKINF